MTDEIKNTNETKPAGLTEVVKPAFKADADAGLSKLTEKLAEPTKPVTAPKPEPVKEVKPVAKDPKGMFDYSNCKQYVVQQGDTLLDVAQKFVVALQQLRYFNHLDKEEPVIRPGKTLYIPDKPINVPYGE